MILGALSFLNFSWIDLLDILMVAAIIFFIFRWIRGSSAFNIFIAIIIVLFVRIIAVALGMKMMSALLGTIIDVGAIALIVIFQPEVRRFLNTIGRSAGSTLEKRNFFQKILTRDSSGVLSSDSIDEIAEACAEMASQKTGALIVIRHNNLLDDIMSTGDNIDAEISRRLIMNIFFKNSPLHDGAMVISNNRITAARCTLPITERQDLPARFGMRHKAAVGISEASDADVIVVSEQTGGISFVHAGKVTPIKSVNVLKLTLGGKVE
ncbi:MAG: diadenylate cyclase CdaA [Bacteroidales bacterium]|nr:diadenylate cyclase CdaA [Bacteroidales bacterium]